MKKNLYDVTRLATLYFPDSTERTTEAVQSITGRTRPVGTPHGTALRHQATELHAPAIRNGHRHPRQAGGNGRRFPRMAVRLEPQHVSNERGKPL